MDKRRGAPGVWAKSLAKLIGGDDRCWYRAWFQSRYFVKRPPVPPAEAERMAGYQRKHDEIVEARRRGLEAEGFMVRVEDAASFRLIGTRAELTGKPDLVGLRTDPEGERALVVDAKSGKRRESDLWQVRIYLFALPLTWLRAKLLGGEVAYSDGSVEVRVPGPAESSRIVAGIKRLSDPEEPPRVGSKFECEECPVVECAERWDDRHHSGTTGIF